MQSTESQPIKYKTGRPVVEKLNPERLYAVEKIVSGQLEKEKTEEIYRNKQRMANVLTRKMDKHDIDEMKLKLEQTAMGLLFNKEQYRVLTSREEKIICTNAAAARRTVNEGFKHADERYKVVSYFEIDEKLLKAETLLRNQNLVGIDIVSRTKNKNAQAVNNGSKSISVNKSPPPLPPKKVISQDNRINPSVSRPENPSVIFRNKLSLSSNFSRPCSVPVMQLSCDSVNARRQIVCQLCLKVVYLAERIQVEGMFIHKKCFRCAFCEQPLRLGNCAQDRNLRIFNPRFFCMQHINIPVLEKIARIEKNGCKGSDAAGSSLSTLNDTLNTFNGYNTSPINQSTTAASVQRTGRNSPSMLLGKTMEKMRAQKEAISALVSSPHKHVTQERAKFEIYGQKKTTQEKEASTSANGTCSGGHDNFSDEELLDDEDEYLSSGKDDEDDDDDDNESDFMEDELVDLESAVLENFDKNLNRSLTEAQALKLLKTFKERRQQKLLEEHRDVGEKCEKINGNYDSARNRREMNAVTTAESSKLVTAMKKDLSEMNYHPIVREKVLAPFMEIKEQACVKAKLKTGGESELRRTSKRHSIPKQSSKVIPRFPRHLSLDLTQNDTERIYAAPSMDRSNFAHSSSPSNDCYQKIATVNSQSNLGLLAQLFSAEKVKTLQSTDEANRAISCFVNSDKVVEDSNLHDANVKKQEDAGSLYKFSSFRALRMEKGERMLSRCASTPTSQTLSTSLSKRHSSFYQNPASSSHSAVNNVSTDSPESKSSPTLFTKKEIRRVQKLAEKILRQKEQERISAAQDLQRELEEIDVRKLEVEAVAGDLERRLCDDAENLWILEQWLLYVQEMVQLKQREEELKLRVSEFEVNEEYKSLQLQLKEIQNVSAGVLIASDSQAEKSILKKTLAVLEMRDAIQKQLKVVRERAWQQKVPEPSTLIGLKGASYRNFKPVFI
uniref:LIM zinc-binding domain-containing protein n=1 Tax=Elaeophora elaphi TaxID=1147741 RepID=A0A0R3RG77_9BILA